MPEYLAPGVYVEEIEIGAKPIEGVSTTTTGFLGMTERGPLNKPTLVASFAEYQRIFGGYLSEKDYGKKRHLPYAGEGFFVNGGQRLYVTRVATEKAAKSFGFLPDISTIALDKEVSARTITPRAATEMKGDEFLLLRDEPQSKNMKLIKYAKALTLSIPLKESYTTDTDITKMKKDATSYKIQKKVTARGLKITLDAVTDLAVEDVLIINDKNNPEICIVESIDTDEKVITVRTPLGFEHSMDVELNKLAPSVTKKKPISVLKTGNTVIPITDTDTDFSTNDAIKIGDEYFIIKSTDKDHAIFVSGEPKRQHTEDTGVKQLSPAIRVEAADEGTWGDRIKIIVKESSISSASLTAPAQNQDYLDLDTVTGMEKGTLLKLHTSPPIYGTVTEVIKTEDTTRVKLQDAIPESLEEGLEVSTVEFDLKVNLKVNQDEIDEFFKNLSMNEEHSRYIEKIITEDTSRLIRVKDVSTTEESLQKITVSTQDKDWVWKLSGGNDGIPIDDSELNTTYEGKDDPEPVKRTGLYTLKNIDEISIAAIPGITTQHLQNKLVIQCESMKDRFAVLDSEEKADFDEIQRQRNLYDSKYAALYYPWIRVFDPLSKKRINVPPSGAICGIYARSDIERGVHKAPANEVVRGALGLEEFDGVKRIITKGQQDILNPKGVNCIRAFPGRGIRVWGARTISSDTLWKYINVRRLFLFLEESIDEGTQWVVFEPNDEKLWARVRQTITQFLTRVWKDGALMGTTAEEAFFVKCDRTTMTQDDIDNGRLIVIIGVAPVKPAEFVIFRIAQWAGGSAVTE
jgi:phage tail sheath protein FI